VNFSPLENIRSRIAFRFMNPSFVFDETGVKRNFNPSRCMTCTVSRLSKSFVPLRFFSIAFSNAFGLADQSTMRFNLSGGRRSHFDRT